MSELWQTWIKLNREYDRLPEPRRFFTFFIPAAIFIVAINSFRVYAVEFESLYAGMMSITLLLVMAIVAVARCLYLKR